MSDDALRGRFRAAAAEPSVPLDWPQVLARGTRRRRRRRVVPVVLTATVALAAAVTVPLAVASRRPSAQVLHGTPASPSWKGAASPARHVPAGWQPVTYGDLQIAVPASWQVVDVAAKPCRAAGGPGVVLGGPVAGLSCPASLKFLVWARSAPVTLPRTGAPTTIDGVTVAPVALPPSQVVAGAQVSYLVPAFGVELTVSAAWARAVIATVSPSARAVVAQQGPLPYTPTQWRSVQLDGVTLRVPPAWPLVNHGPALCGLLAPWAAPQVDVGPGQPGFGVSCIAPRVQHFVPAVWVFADPGKASASWGTVVGEFHVSGGTVQVFSGDPAATWVPVLVTPSGHGTPVGMWLGVGNDGVLARVILGSIEVAGP